MGIEATILSPIQKRFESKLLDLLSERNAQDKRFPLSPSQVLSCQRRLSYDLINYDAPGSIPSENYGLRQLLVFDNGHRTEDFMFDWLSKTPGLEILRDKERLDICDFGERKITGEIDRWVKDTKRDILFIADCKATNTQSFKRLEESCIPKDSHYYQVQLYLSSPQAQAKGATHGMIVYSNKDTQAILILEFPFDEEAAKYAISRLYTIYSQKGTVLPRDYVFGRDWQCGSLYCPYHAVCYSGFNNPSSVEITTDNEILDDYLTDKKNSDKFNVINTLLGYGDHTEYKYKNKTFTLDKLKTTLSVGLKKE